MIVIDPPVNTGDSPLFVPSVISSIRNDCQACKWKFDDEHEVSGKKLRVVIIGYQDCMGTVPAVRGLGDIPGLLTYKPDVLTQFRQATEAKDVAAISNILEGLVQQWITIYFVCPEGNDSLLPGVLYSTALKMIGCRDFLRYIDGLAMAGRKPHQVVTELSIEKRYTSKATGNPYGSVFATRVENPSEEEVAKLKAIAAEITPELGATIEAAKPDIYEGLFPAGPSTKSDLIEGLLLSAGYTLPGRLKSVEAVPDLSALPAKEVISFDALPSPGSLGREDLCLAEVEADDFGGQPNIDSDDIPF